MRRHVATFVAAAFLLSVAGPAVAGDPVDPVRPAPVVGSEPSPTPDAPPSAEPTPSTEPEPQPSAEPGEPGETWPLTDPSVEPSVDPGSGADRATEPAASPTSAADPTGRWIVIYKSGTDVAATSARQARAAGFTADRTFKNAFRGLAAKLSPQQVTTLRRDPAVLAVVPDEKIELAAQLTPTGIDRIGGRLSAAAKIDGIDERINADVAIVDTGIATVADLNVAGGYNCSTSNRSLWRDVHGHGTHVAGTVGAIDNGSGVVGVAPGVRLWAVKILDDTGTGLLSWYVCGLDWIAAQRDPSDSSRPRFESVNMSVAKWGSDDKACGSVSDDVLHAAICRLVDSGVTVIAAAANDSSSAAARVPAAYNEVITVSALADTDGKPGGLGGPRCFSWGSYDDDDTFANFSNYGSDVDMIAPGKCIWSTVPGGYQYMSGTSMAAPHVAGAAALIKASRPHFTPAEVKEALQYLGTLDWKITSDPDPTHEKLLNTSKVGPRGDFSIAVGPKVVLPEEGGIAVFPVTVTRSPTSFERITLRADNLPTGVRASFDKPSLYGFDGVSATMSVTVPTGIAPGSYQVTVVGVEHGLGRTATATFAIEGDPPVASPPTTDALPRAVIGPTSVPVRVVWPAAVDPTSGIAGYEVEQSIDGGAWGATVVTGSTPRQIGATQTLGKAYRFRVRARDTVGNWSAWAPGNSYTAALVEDRSPSVVFKGSWIRVLYKYASGGNVSYATAAGASAKLTFTGRAIGFVAPLGPTRGKAKIYWDGVYRTTISFYAPKGQSRLVMYSIGSATHGTHSLEVRLVGDGRVDVDAFVTFR
jgi:subtilisin family serine protease